MKRSKSRPRKPPSAVPPKMKAGTLTPGKAVTMAPAPTGGYPSVLRSHLGFCLYKSAIRLRALLDSAFLEHGLISPQFGIMSILVANGSLSQIDMGQRMTIDKATMVKLIDSLESLHLVRRKAHAQDRRVRLVELTAHGLTLFNRLLATAKDVEIQFTAKLSTSEREMLRSLTSRLLD